MTEKRRYLVITEKFPPRKGGSNLWFDEVYRRIGNKGTHIVTCHQPGAAQYDADHPNTVHRLALGRQRWLRPESLAIYLKLFLKSLGLALRYRFDAIHAGRVLSEGFVGLIVARLRGLPLVIYAHGEEITTWRQPVKFKVMRLIYQRADRIIANSEFTRGELLKLGIRLERIMLIYPGVDLRRFRPGLPIADLRASLKLSADSKVILSVGRLFRRKGFDQVVRALPSLIARGIDVHYVLIGIGEDHDYLATLAGELGVGQRVHLLGHIAAEDLPRWYNMADVFAMPNRSVDNDTEGFGMVFLEAAACGKPVLAGKAGGTGAAVADNVTGLRVEGELLEAVAAGLARLLEDRGFARQLGENGYARVLKNFSWGQVAKKTIVLDEGLLEGLPRDRKQAMQDKTRD